MEDTTELVEMYPFDKKHCIRNSYCFSCWPLIFFSDHTNEKLTYFILPKAKGYIQPCVIY